MTIPSEVLIALIWLALALIALVALRAGRFMTTPPKDAPVTNWPCPVCHNIDGHSFDCPRKDAPVTEAGRLREVLAEHGIGGTTNDGPHSWRCDYYKDIDPEKGGGPCDCIDALIVGIEAATAARSVEIDVETLARAYRNLQRPGARDDVEIAPGWLQDAHTIAAEYARLRSEPPKDAPKRQRIDWSNVVVDEGDEAP